MRVVSVNVSPVRTLSAVGRQVTTGIFKAPIEGRVRVRKLGLEGDAQADLRVHGGLDKAVYAYPSEHYAYWEKDLRKESFPFGQFGENLTTVGLDERNVCIGDIFRVGETILQVSEPREPCFKLALRMEMATFPKLFLASGRVGFYLRVLEEGEVWAGAGIESLERDGRAVSVVEMVRILTTGPRLATTMKQALEIPSLSARLRSKLTRWLAEEISGTADPGDS